MQLSFLPNHSSPVNGSIHCSLVDRLEQSGLIDTREDKASLIHCLRALDGSADAKRWKGWPNGGKEAPLIGK